MGFAGGAPGNKMVGTGGTPSFPCASPAKPLAPPFYSVSCLGDSKRDSKLLFGKLLGPSVSPSGLLCFSYFIQYLALGIQKGIPSVSLVSYWAPLLFHLSSLIPKKVSQYKMVGPGYHKLP